jgi:hypothetical protein
MSNFGSIILPKHALFAEAREALEIFHEYLDPMCKIGLLAMECTNQMMKTISVFHLIQIYAAK